MPLLQKIKSLHETINSLHSIIADLKLQPLQYELIDRLYKIIDKLRLLETCFLEEYYTSSPLSPQTIITTLHKEGKIQSLQLKILHASQTYLTHKEACDQVAKWLEET